MRARISTLWDEVEWRWFTRDERNVLYWHWSPYNGWAMDHQIRGWNECLITYVLAASSRRYAIEPEVYTQGFASDGAMRSGKSWHDIELPLGMPYGGPLFFAHYSFCGIDPRGLTDRYADYWAQNVHHVLINRAHCMVNPNGSRRARRSVIAPGSGRGRRLLASLPERGRGGREHGAHGVVELAQAPEAGPEGHLAEGEVGGLDEDPSGLRTLGPGERERAGTQLGDEEAVEVAGAVPEPVGEAGHALPVDDPVGDEAHGARDGVARGCSTRASPAPRRAGSACTSGTRPSARPPRSRRSGRCRAWACGRGSSAGSRRPSS